MSTLFAAYGSAIPFIPLQIVTWPQCLWSMSTMFTACSYYNNYEIRAHMMKTDLFYYLSQSMITLFATYKKVSWCKPLIAVDSYLRRRQKLLALTQNWTETVPITLYRTEPICNQSNQTSTFLTCHEPNRQILLLNQLFSNWTRQMYYLSKRTRPTYYRLNRT